jgi:D-alanyl-D-alanine carboxypeptidase
MKITILICALTASISFINFFTPNLEYRKEILCTRNYDLEKELDILIPQQLSNNKQIPVNNVLLYIENEKTGFIYHKAFGFRNEEKTDTAQKQDLFKIASTNKTITAAVVMQMYEEGNFDLNDSIYNYLKDNKFINFDNLHLYSGKSYGNTITIAQALSHTSGLTDLFQEGNQFKEYAFSNMQQQWNPQSLFEKYYAFGLNKKARFVPGTKNKFSYSDVNYFLLGLLIEKVSKNSYEKEVRKRILLPLQMNDTYFEYREPKKTANTMVETFLGDFNVTRNMNTSFDWAGGGYVSTTLDLKKFIVGLMNNKIFKKSTTLQKMITDYGGIAAQNQIGAGYGYGIEVLKINGSVYYGHGGYWGSNMAYSVEKKVVACSFVGQSENYTKTNKMFNEALRKVEQ